MTKRGVDLGGELRYLEPSYTGIIQGRLHALGPAARRRPLGLFACSTSKTWCPTLQVAAASACACSLNRVSDDNYWSDFPRSITSLTSRLLPSDVTLGWSQRALVCGSRGLQMAGPAGGRFDLHPALRPAARAWASTTRSRTRRFWARPTGTVSLQSNFTRFERSSLVSGSTVTVGRRSHPGRGPTVEACAGVRMVCAAQRATACDPVQHHGHHRWQPTWPRPGWCRP